MPTTELDPHNAANDLEVAGLDHLQLDDDGQPSFGARLWSAAWPKIGAVGIALLLWQAVVWSGWKREDILPGPWRVFQALGDGVADGSIPRAIGITLQRASSASRWPRSSAWWPARSSPAGA